MTTSFLEAFLNPVPPGEYHRPRQKGSWLAKDEPAVVASVATETKPAPADKWNRKGMVQSSYSYTVERSSKANRPKSAPSVGRPASGERPGTAGSASKQSRPQSAWSDATTAAMTRDSPTPDLYKDDEIGNTETPIPLDMMTKEEKMEEKISPTIEAFRKSLDERNKKMKWLLMHRGRDMTEDEYERLVMDAMKPRHRSKSRFESCLTPERARHHPAQVGHHTVIGSLKKDKESYRGKYPQNVGQKLSDLLSEKSPQLKHPGASVSMSQAWKLPTSSYTISAPKGSQHDKFSKLEPKKNIFTAGERKFAVHTLRQWFTAIDTEKKGVLSRRQMLNALFHHRELCDIFGKAAGVDAMGYSTSQTVQSFRGMKDEMHNQYKTLGADEDDIESIHGDDYETGNKAAELREIAKILREIDEDNSGTMSWVELVEFFRKTGHLLEYETEKGVKQNDKTAFWMDQAMKDEAPLQRQSLLQKRDSILRPDKSKGDWVVPNAIKGRGETQKKRDSVRRESLWRSRNDASSPQSRTITRSKTEEEEEEEEAALIAAGIKDAADPNNASYAKNRQTRVSEVFGGRVQIEGLDIATGPQPAESSMALGFGLQAASRRSEYYDEEGESLGHQGQRITEITEGSGEED